jgi:hypothetical protein
MSRQKLICINLTLFFCVAILFYLTQKEILRDPLTDITNRMHYCIENGWTNECYIKETDELLKIYSPSELLNSLSTLEQVPDVFVKCHEVTHYIGRNLYDINTNIPDAYGSCTSTCWGGCYHGVLESYLQSKGYNSDLESDLIGKDILTMCESQRYTQSNRLYFECVHGVGHAVMFITNLNLQSSLAYCDLFSQKSEQDACYGGVFMEYSSSSTNLAHGESIPNDDPLYPCSVLPDQYLPICYQYQSSYFMIRENSQWDKVIALCNLVPSEYKKSCFLFIGTNQAGYTTDIEKSFSTCRMIDDIDMKAECVRGIIIGNGARYVNDSERLTKICQSIDTQYKITCKEESIKWMRSWGWSDEKIKSISFGN